MTKYFLHTLLCLLVCLISSCKEENDIGDLYGQWQITRIERGNTSLSPTRAFLAFQNDCVFARLIEVDDHYTVAITGGFRQMGDSISLCFYIDEENEGAEANHSYLSEDFSFPEPHNDIRFEIKQLDSHNLILCQGDNLWKLRSY